MCGKTILYRFDVIIPHVLVLNTRSAVVHPPWIAPSAERYFSLFRCPPFSPKAKRGHSKRVPSLRLWTQRGGRCPTMSRLTEGKAPLLPHSSERGAEGRKEAEGRSHIGITSACLASRIRTSRIAKWPSSNLLDYVML